MRGDKNPAGSRGDPATGAGPAKHPRLNESSHAEGDGRKSSAGAADWDHLATRAMADLDQLVTQATDELARSSPVTQATGRRAPPAEGAWDQLVTRALARLSAVLWTLRGAGALAAERRLVAGARAILAAEVDGGPDASA